VTASLSLKSTYEVSVQPLLTVTVNDKEGSDWADYEAPEPHGINANDITALPIEI
jgi:hypothetical protein